MIPHHFLLKTNMIPSLRGVPFARIRTNPSFGGKGRRSLPRRQAGNLRFEIASASLGTLPRNDNLESGGG